MSTVATAPRRVRAHVEGTVQGVGYRPFVHRLAAELGLAGWVGNDEHGVVVEVEGADRAVAGFLGRLATDAPPLARVERVRAGEVAATGAPGFAIVPSRSGGRADALVAPDCAPCADCLAELEDPQDRRYRYPFVNCTNCGPRYTIVLGVPYDRPLTTMASFAMCAACRAEYDDPADRRFHAQPNACPDCGPSARFTGAARGIDAVAAAACALRDGAVVAVKGVGGYHLACRADDEAAVAALRARKRREERPFALMAAGLDVASALVETGGGVAALLLAPERPIVLAARRPGAPVASGVAPGCPELGVMLPSTPLHHLLLADVGVPLVMTSGNVSDEPIAYRDADAAERLAGIADAFLVHDRPIRTRVDDSVVRPGAILRRGRGHVPRALTLPVPASRPLLACGAELKSTFCVARGERAWVGQHVGDLKNVETLAAYAEGIELLGRLFAVAPELVVHDEHPDHLSTRYALGREGVGTIAVQHHHAHLAACLAEHGETGPAVGAIFDGSGYGSDGTVWGGEILVGDLVGFERAAHLAPVPLPGGDTAVRQPWRMACAWLGAAGEDCPSLRERIDPVRWRAVASMARTGVAAPMSTSAGRLFDAVAALCGLRTEVSYEGQAAIELEAACDRAERGAYAPDGLDPRPMIGAVVADVAAGVPVGVIAARFHHGLADATAAACVAAAHEHGLDTVVLSGGVFQNRRLLHRTRSDLAAAGLRVLVPERLPANDGGIAFGQAAVGAATEARA